jgi:3-hydroxyacyl-CoA dehydrogenase
MAIRKAAVIGAGVMGTAIAAQLADAGIEVELLDRPLQGNDNRNAVSDRSIEDLRTISSPLLMHKNNAKRIQAGNTEDDMARLKDCDLIIEAVSEDLQVKSDLFKKIDANRQPGSIVASTTSTIALRKLVAGQSDSFRKDFVIAHFPTPSRQTTLLEMVTSADNNPDMVKELAQFMDETVGKTVVHCKGEPGYVATRIGSFWMQSAISEALKRKLSVEEADAIAGAPMGFPKTGLFGLADILGLDQVSQVANSLADVLPRRDEYRTTKNPSPVIEGMLANGYVGNHGKGGFYSLNDKQERHSVNLETGAVAPSRKVKMKAAEKARKKGLRGLIESKDKGGDHAWAVLKQTLCYAAAHAHEVASDVNTVDQAMRAGYNWKQGPFEMIDRIGVDYFIKRLEAEGENVPELLEKARGKTFYKTIGNKLHCMNKDGGYDEVKRPEGILLLADVKRDKKNLVAKNRSASLWDIGDGVLCLEFHSKMNSLDPMIFGMMNKACDIIEKGKHPRKFKALVIHNDAPNFSAGANLAMALYAGKAKQYWLVEKLVKMGQDTFKRLKYAPFPVVSATAGKALGGACEVLLHSHAVQAHADLHVGLVEVIVGLLPAWGGSTELLTRAQKNQPHTDPMSSVRAVFETISHARVAASAFEAKDLMYLRETDGVTMNKARLLADAKKKALAMTRDFRPEQPLNLTLPGPAGAAELNATVDALYQKGTITSYDVVILDKVARVLTGGERAGPGIAVTQDDVRIIEREKFKALLHDKRTSRRAETILKTAKPFREPPEENRKTAEELRQESVRPGLFNRAIRNPLKRMFNDARHRGKPPRDVTNSPPPPTKQQP